MGSNTDQQLVSDLFNNSMKQVQFASIFSRGFKTYMMFKLSPHWWGINHKTSIVYVLYNASKTLALVSTTEHCPPCTVRSKTYEDDDDGDEHCFLCLFMGEQQHIIWWGATCIVSGTSKQRGIAEAMMKLADECGICFMQVNKPQNQSKNWWQNKLGCSTDMWWNPWFGNMKWKLRSRTSKQAQTTKRMK